MTAGYGSIFQGALFFDTVSGMRLLGIDYGHKRIGVAVGNIQENIAFPLHVIEGGEGSVPRVQKIAKEEGVDAFVVGLPIGLQGQETDMTREVRAFAKKLESIGLPVHLEPELLSTKAIQKGTVKKEKVDAAAAALILQSYMDRM